MVLATPINPFYLNNGRDSWTRYSNLSFTPARHFVVGKYVEKGCWDGGGYWYYYYRNRPPYCLPECQINPDNIPLRVKKDCGTDALTNEWRCSGNTLERKWIIYGCSGNDCTPPQEKWEKWDECASGSTKLYAFRSVQESDTVKLQQAKLERGCYDDGKGNASCYSRIIWENL